ncbi:elongation factor 1-beta [Methanobrevibacter sp.]|jgi:elongation factor 1-beta|uniref:elongation factor 1-beta n=1 Tax=Methanobrevibacter sp. TaxID=66852 RepID=UPI00386E44CE
MGEVLTTMKVMPDSPDVDLEAIKATIKDSMPEGAKLNDMKEEPIAFGLVAIIISFITEDGEGGSEPVEEMVSGIEGVASIEITGVGRLM